MKTDPNQVFPARLTGALTMLVRPPSSVTTACPLFARRESIFCVFSENWDQSGNK